jgi:hypothetical protein
MCKDHNFGSAPPDRDPLLENYKRKHDVSNLPVGDVNDPDVLKDIVNRLQ